MVLKSSWWCMLVSLIVTACHCLEEDRPETSLAPRNFNPHPYQAGYEGGGRPLKKSGPVLFPVTSSGLFINEGAYTVSGSENSDRHSVDEHPYAELAKRRKYEEASRFQDEKEDNQVDLVAYRALAEHGAKVLNIPPMQLKESYANEKYSDGKKNYAFSYKVSNQNNGDQFSHKQTHNLASTSGEYRVKLPDGREQIVSYKADKNGYNADVQYIDESTTSTFKDSGIYIETNDNKIFPTEMPISTDSYRKEFLKVHPYILLRDYVTSDVDSRYVLEATPYRSFEVDKSKVNIISGSSQENIVKYVGSTTAPYTITPQSDYLEALSTTVTPFIDKIIYAK